MQNLLLKKLKQKKPFALFVSLSYAIEIRVNWDITIVALNKDSVWIIVMITIIIFYFINYIIYALLKPKKHQNLNIYKFMKLSESDLLLLMLSFFFSSLKPWYEHTRITLNEWCIFDYYSGDPINGIYVLGNI